MNNITMIQRIMEKEDEKSRDSIKVIREIMEAENFDTKVAIVNALGVDVVKNAMHDCVDNRTMDIPHVLYDILGPFMEQRNIEIINNIIAAKDNKTRIDIAKAYGLEAVKKAYKDVVGTNDLLPEVRGVIYVLEEEKHQKVVENIINADDYASQLLIAKVYGYEAVKEAFYSLGEKNVPHIIKDIVATLSFYKSKDVLNSIMAAESYEDKVAVAKALGVDSVNSAVKQFGAYNSEKIPQVIEDVIASLNNEKQNS